ncbi:hypothetical protein [Nocardioides flavescens]|uniref:Uncharacterized protein n=1 Tax=Nocardioides flavescens TaxID=2691959 RepID=A0A6L7ERB3_9ACTN|nr:hypothetical protein [Nocardioides flavescens]MXG88136.1 hypothetical protein [Nocardioides flavescens]
MGRRERVLVALVALVAPLLVVGLVSLSGGAQAVKQPGAFDSSVGATQCALLGRRWSQQRGCARSRCVAGAVLFNANLGAEVCASRAGAPYGTYVEPSRCVALGRVWVASANYCASSPDRGTEAVAGAPQCRAPDAVYVVQGEKPGHYDECLAPAYADQLRGLAAAAGTTLAQQVDRRSALQCGDRVGRAMVDGVCALSDAPPPAHTDQTLVIGDSLGWRSADELEGRRPGWAVDAMPSRKIGELRGRLDAYRAVHGQPSALVVELGTNATTGFSERDLRSSVRSLPRSTAVLFVLPYRQVARGNAPSAATYGGWMRDLARTRSRTCVADWPRLLDQRPGLLLDGTHPTHRGEKVYAGLLATGLSGCR